MDTRNVGHQISVEPTKGTQMCVSCYAQSWEEGGHPSTPIYMVNAGRTAVPLCENCIREIFRSASKLGLNMTINIDV